MKEQDLRLLLRSVQNGGLDIGQALEQLLSFPTDSPDCACLDHGRELRTGLPEAVFGENKSSAQLIAILAAMSVRDSVVLATRVDSAKAGEVCRELPGLTYHPVARMLTGNAHCRRQREVLGEVLVITAGTSDLPVAEEARIALEQFGHPVAAIQDVGVAGLHRILAHNSRLREAAVCIVVAGMEGALPSVVAGLTPAPVIGVPTSIGYGTGSGGFAALLGMLNSCAPGLAVVNIDNGFGAACMAAAINSKRG